jgi:hypothetical protein
MVWVPGYARRVLLNSDDEIGNATEHATAQTFGSYIAKETFNHVHTAVLQTPKFSNTAVVFDLLVYRRSSSRCSRANDRPGGKDQKQDGDHEQQCIANLAVDQHAGHTTGDK